MWLKAKSVKFVRPLIKTLQALPLRPVYVKVLPHSQNFTATLIIVQIVHSYHSQVVKKRSYPSIKLFLVGSWRKLLNLFEMFSVLSFFFPLFDVSGGQQVIPHFFRPHFVFCPALLANDMVFSTPPPHPHPHTPSRCVGFCSKR
jgi:hypothetical protein